MAVLVFIKNNMDTTIMAKAKCLGHSMPELLYPTRYIIKKCNSE